MSNRRRRSRKRSSTKKSGVILVKLLKAKPPKKWMAVFNKNGKIYHRWFGAHGYEDYTMHKDKDRMLSYRRRHKKDLRTNDPMRAGYLSYFILWNQTSLTRSVADYRKRLAVYNRTGVFPTRIAAGGAEFSSKYVPKSLSPRDRRKQERGLRQARRAYRKGVYLSRPKVRSPKRKSPHIRNAKRMYSVNSVRPTSRKLSEKSGCSTRAMRRIVRKGRGAYYSSGSRPNQTSDSWAYARLASALTGGKASCYDRHILEIGCRKNSKALRLMKKTCGRR